MNKKARLETVNHFFKAQQLSTQHCLEPNEACKRSAIRAHSIPSSTVMAYLAQGGHVVMPQIRHYVNQPYTVEFGRIGKNKASTFTGLCDQHDNEIFRPVDDRLPDLGNQSHLFLLAYRAVLREYHTVLQNGLRFQSTYLKQVELGILPGNEPSDPGLLAVANLANAYESYEFKRKFDYAYLERDWSRLRHHVIVLEDQPPTIAVSSMFSLDDIDAPETPRVTLSIFPVGSNVAVVFSAISSDAPFVTAYLDRILNSQGAFQKYLLSKLVLQSCENFVINPQYYDQLPEDRKNALCRFFVITARQNADDHEDERLYLF